MRRNKKRNVTYIFVELDQQELQIAPAKAEGSEHEVIEAEDKHDGSEGSEQGQSNDKNGGESSHELQDEVNEPMDEEII